MASENVRERRGNPRYTVVLVPEGETKRPWTVSFTRWGLVAGVAGTFLVIVSLVVAAFVYTPIGARLPIPRSDLEQRYGKQIVGIQEQLQSLIKEMTVLRSYNLRLRAALGEKVQDTAAMNATAGSTSRDSLERLNPSEVGASEPGPSQFPLRSDGGDAANVDRAGSKQRLAEFPLVAPAEGFVSQSFDPRQFHYGADFAGKVGSAVLAAADGNVVFAGWTYDDGYTMLLTHDQGIMTVYKHNEALLKTTGMAVKRGEVIALLGNTGNTSSGPHLHFEVWKDGVPQDPANYLLTTQ